MLTITYSRHARPARPLAAHPTVTRHIQAPIDVVFSLLADVHQWARWGPFTNSAATLEGSGLPNPIRLGRHQMRIAIATPDAPYWLRYRITGGPAGSRHRAEITLSPTSDGGTDWHWRATLPAAMPGLGRRRTIALVAAVTELSAHLASAAEDPPTTRAEWADHVRSGSVYAQAARPFAA